MDEPWDGSERRHPLPHRRLGSEPTNSDLMDLIEHVRAEHAEHVAEERPVLRKILAAFVNGDFDRHRDEHNALAAIIEREKAEAQFWTTMKMRAAETGLLGLMRIIGTLLLLGIGVLLGLKFDWIGIKG